MQLRYLVRLALVPAAVIGLALIVLVVAAPAAHAAGGGTTQIDGGQGDTCAVWADGKLKCWGNNSFGKAPSSPEGSFVRVNAGGDHTCAIKTDGTLACWGSNSVVECESVNGTCWDVDTGQARPPAGVFEQVTSGASHSCALAPGGSVSCWGWNGPANDGETGWGRGKSGPFTELTSGHVHNCAVRKSDGTAACWGYSLYGQLKAPAGVVFKQLAAGENHTCGLTPGGDVKCWGGNTWGQAPDLRAGPYAEIAAGDLFTCGLKPDGQIDCWGYNFYGQRKAPTGVWTSFGLGDAHGCATNDDTGAWACWGKNASGQANPPLPAGTPVTPFPFQGFFRPLAPDTGKVPVLNVVTAGSSVPLKFSLGGDKGLDLIEKDYPASGSLDCATLDAGAALTPAKSAGGDALTYDPASGQYSYVWKTEKTWAGTCRYLSLQLVDGTEHRAAFQFK